MRKLMEIKRGSINEFLPPAMTSTPRKRFSRHKRSVSQETAATRCQTAASPVKRQSVLDVLGMPRLSDLESEKSIDFVYQSTHRAVSMSPAQKSMTQPIKSVHSRPITQLSQTVHYDHIRPITSTFRPRIPSRTKAMSFEEIEHEKRQNELILNNNHQLLRVCKGAKKEVDVKFENNKFEKRFARMAGNIQALNKGQETKKAERDFANTRFNIAANEARKKSAAIYAQNWIHTHSQNVEDDQIRAFEFAKFLFDSVDIDMSETIEGKELIECLIGLGLADTYENISATIKDIFQVRDLESLSIGFYEFAKIFKGNIRITRYLDILNEEWRIKKYGKQPEQTFKALPMPRSLETSRSSSPDGKEKDKEVVKEISLGDQLQIIKDWWKELDLINYGSVDAYKIGKFLVQKDFEGNLPKARAVALTFSDKGANELTFVDFSKMFSRCIFKGALKSLADRLYSSEYYEKDAPPAQILNAYRRRLIMSGLQYESTNIKPDEGKAVITAVKNYRESKGKYHPPQDTKAYQRHLSKLLLNIESDEVYDRIQRKKELENYNRAQDEKRKKEAKQQQRTRLDVLKAQKPRASFMVEMLPGRVSPPKSPFPGIHVDTPKIPLPMPTSDSPTSPLPSIFETTISSLEDMKMDTLAPPRAHVSTPTGVHNISELPEPDPSEVSSKLSFKVVCVSPRPKTQQSAEKDLQSRQKKKRSQGYNRASRIFDKPRPKIMEEFIQINTFGNYVEEHTNIKMAKEKKKKVRIANEYDYEKEPVLLEKDIKQLNESEYFKRFVMAINYDPDGNKSNGFGSSAASMAQNFLKGHVNN